MAIEYSAQLWQDDDAVAIVFAPTLDQVRRDIAGYVSQYAQDGPFEVKFFRIEELDDDCCG